MAIPITRWLLQISATLFELGLSALPVLVGGEWQPLRQRIMTRRAVMRSRGGIASC